MSISNESKPYSSLEFISFVHEVVEAFAALDDGLDVLPHDALDLLHLTLQHRHLAPARVRLREFLLVTRNYGFEFGSPNIAKHLAKRTCPGDQKLGV